MIDQPYAIRIEPPLPKRIYYKGFISRYPAQPGQQLSQHWEVHLKKTDEGFSGNMIFYEAYWDKEKNDTAFKKKEFPVKSPEDLRKVLDADIEERKKNNKRMPSSVLLVYLDDDVRYGDLLKFLEPAMATNNNIHIFLKSQPPK